MQDIKHCDILWVDDFDKSEKVDNPRRYLKDYFPPEFSFRVRIEKNFFNALVHLEKILQTTLAWSWMSIS